MKLLIVLFAIFCVLAHPSANWAAPLDQEIGITTEQTVSTTGIDASKIPSEKVNQFVHACLQVVALIDQREGELQAAETESESQQIQRDIEREAIALIEQAGLTRQEYLQLLSLTNVDSEFGDRVAALLLETPGAGG